MASPKTRRVLADLRPKDENDVSAIYSNFNQLKNCFSIDYLASRLFFEAFGNFLWIPLFSSVLIYKIRYCIKCIKGIFVYFKKNLKWINLEKIHCYVLSPLYYKTWSYNV